jgi:threonine dehydratase
LPRSFCLPRARPLITRADVEAAAARLSPHVLQTPLRRSEWLSSIAGAPVSLKLETLQETFSYKFRGALNAVLRLCEGGGRPSGLVTASAGNHGRALAAAAAKVGLPLTVYVPATAPKVKLDAMKALGAHVELCADYDEAECEAQLHDAPGVVYVSPYAHPFVIEGAGTVAVEILAQDPLIEVVVCPVGGGGLASGIAIAAAGRAETWGVETEASCPFTRSLAAGRVVAIDVQPSLADGLAGNLDPGTITFDLVRQHVAGIATVTESQVARAIGQLAASERLIAEGAAAVGVAGVVNGRVPLAGRRTAIVLTGANIDVDKLRQLI